MDDKGTDEERNIILGFTLAHTDSPHEDASQQGGGAPMQAAPDQDESQHQPEPPQYSERRG